VALIGSNLLRQSICLGFSCLFISFILFCSFLVYIFFVFFCFLLFSSSATIYVGGIQWCAACIYLICVTSLFSWSSSNYRVLVVCLS